MFLVRQNVCNMKKMLSQIRCVKTVNLEIQLALWLLSLYGFPRRQGLILCRADSHQSNRCDENRRHAQTHTITCFLHSPHRLKFYRLSKASICRLNGDNRLVHFLLLRDGRRARQRQ